MIIFTTGKYLAKKTELRHAMYRDRAHQFSKRLNWEVTVNDAGEEQDQYDALDPIYLIASDDGRSHFGSIRLLPTTGKTMVNDHFKSLNRNVSICDRNIWECTRFCVSPNASRNTAASLMAAAFKLKCEYQIHSFVGVFGDGMKRLFCRNGVPPIILGSSNVKGSRVSLGLWSLGEKTFQTLATRSGQSPTDYELYFVNSPLVIGG